MYPWVQLSHLAEWSGGNLVNLSKQDPFIPAISTDSRAVKKGEVFVALRGENFDGHDYVEDAISKGALALILEHPVKTSVPTIVVHDCLSALIRIAEKLRANFTGTAFGITGSAGKSSTKEMVGALLGPDTVVAPASFNNLLGVSKTLCLIDSTTKNLVLELGMNAEGEIAEMCSRFKPRMGLITNIGTAHVGKLGSKEGIFRAKKELFDYLATIERPGIALNIEDSNVERAFTEAFGETLPESVVTYSADGKQAQVTLVKSGLDPTTGYLQLHIRVGEDTLDFKGALFGLHHGQNLVAAIALALVVKTPLKDIRSRLNLIRPAAHRGEIYELSDHRILIDESYNSNPTALDSAIDSFVKLDPSRPRLLVVGDMREMGEFSSQVHKEAGEHIAKATQGQTVTLVAVGNEIGPLVKAFKSGNASARCIQVDSVAKAINEAKAFFTPGTFCLVKGSRGVTLDRLVTDYLKNYR